MKRTIQVCDLYPGLRIATGEHRGATIRTKRTTGEGPSTTVTITLSTGVAIFYGTKCKVKVEL
jgi:hypothetical protein